MKFVFGLEYDGHSYFGWQKQNCLPTIQYFLECALSKIANHKVTVVCSGRTDRGVHSIGQIAHFETFVLRSCKTWLIGLNSLLPKDITVLWIRHVNDFFHARFSTLTRTYRYLVLNKSVRSSFLKNYCTFVYLPLDIKKMRSASLFLIGEHNFNAFRGSRCQSSSPYRTIKSFHILKFNNFIIFEITANSFLYHMVRNIVGSLLIIGLLKKEIKWMLGLLNNNYRTDYTAPSNGLYFISASYPKLFNIPIMYNSLNYFLKKIIF